MEKALFPTSLRLQWQPQFWLLMFYPSRSIPVYGWISAVKDRTPDCMSSVTWRHPQAGVDMNVWGRTEATGVDFFVLGLTLCEWVDGVKRGFSLLVPKAKESICNLMHYWNNQKTRWKTLSFCCSMEWLMLWSQFYLIVVILLITPSFCSTHLPLHGKHY